MTATIAITNGTLIDGTGSGPRLNGTILIENGRITSVDAAEIPAGVQVIDAEGQWVLPGIVNGNIHLLDGIMMMGVGGVEYLARYEGNLTSVIEEAAQIALAAGQTTVFDTWNATGPVLASRDRIASGEVPGARIFAAGNIVGMGGPFSADFNLRARQVISTTFANRLDELFSTGVGAEDLSLLAAEDIRPIIRNYLARGVDMLKIAVSDHLLPTLGATRGYLTFSERALKVMLEEGRAAGVPTLAHITSVEALEISVELGFDVIIHSTMTGQVAIPQATIDKILEKGIYCGVQSVNAAYQSLLEQIQHPFTLYGGGVHIENEQRLIAAGASIMLGTDAGCTSHDVLTDQHGHGDLNRPWTLGTDHVAWGQALIEKGMSHLQVIESSTRIPAEAYGKSADIGTLEVGKFGDVLVLGSDPLDDITALLDVTTVVKAGEVVDRAALPLQPLASVPIPGDPS